MRLAWDVHWGCGVLTHGQMRGSASCSCFQMPRNPCAFRVRHRPECLRGQGDPLFLMFSRRTRISLTPHFDWKSCCHRCPFWLIWLKNRGPWLPGGRINYQGHLFSIKGHLILLVVRLTFGFLLLGRDSEQLAEVQAGAGARGRVFSGLKNIRPLFKAEWPGKFLFNCQRFDFLGFVKDGLRKHLPRMFAWLAPLFVSLFFRPVELATNIGLRISRGRPLVVDINPHLVLMSTTGSPNKNHTQICELLAQGKTC